MSNFDGFYSDLTSHYYEIANQFWFEESNRHKLLYSMSEKGKPGNAVYKFYVKCGLIEELIYSDNNKTRITDHE